MKNNLRAIAAVTISCLLAVVIGITEETYTHIFSSYFSNEYAESYGYLYYYQFHLLYLFFKPFLLLLSERLNWYNIIISIICIGSIYTLLSQFAKFKPDVFTWLTILVAAVVFSVDIFNIHFTRAAVLCAIVCVTALLFTPQNHTLILFFIIGLLTRNEMFWLAFTAVSPFLFLREKPFSTTQKIALFAILVLPIFMFSIANITRYSNFKTQYLYEKNLDTGGFFFSWKADEDVHDSIQYIKYKIFDRDVLADTVNISQEYLINNFRYSGLDYMANGQILKIKQYLLLFTDFLNYPILSLYLLFFLFLFPLYIMEDKEQKQVLQKLIAANIFSFLVLCGITGLFKFEPACQETIFSFLIFANYFYVIKSPQKLTGLIVLILVTATFVLLYKKQEAERKNNQSIAQLKGIIAKKCTGQILYPVGRVYNILMKHSNPYILNDNSIYKDVLFINNYGAPLMFLGFNDKISKYYRGNILYNYDLINQISSCSNCDGVFIADTKDIELYTTYYRMIYKRDIEFTKTADLGSGLPFVNNICLYKPPVLKSLSDTLK
jgi:hypothetical protein